MKKLVTVSIVFLLTVAISAANRFIAIEENYPPPEFGEMVKSFEKVDDYVLNSPNGVPDCRVELNFCHRTDTKAVVSDYSDLIQLYSEFDWPDVSYNYNYLNISNNNEPVALVIDNTVKIRGKTNSHTNPSFIIKPIVRSF